MGKKHSQYDNHDPSGNEIGEIVSCSLCFENKNPVSSAFLSSYFPFETTQLEIYELKIIAEKYAYGWF